ncbi:MAG: leucine-rich repeat-containing serine/threonine-protein kinase [Burkholderiales bacterium]|nr:leucine-rich repeat-containing serine/threonine-protein kinase [Burkholderiales bacterium]
MYTLLRTGHLAGSTRLSLSCGLKQFPTEIYDLADTLEILDLSGNALSSLPDDLPRLHRLRVIFCSNNRFTHVPEVLGACPQLSMVGFKANRIRHLPSASLPAALRWLILTDNQLCELPAALGSCARLQKLMLAGNRLQRLPDEMAACHELELLRISANRFASLPECVLSLPRLAWLAFAGNPFSDVCEAEAMAKTTAHSISWTSLELQHKLGEGASGVIHQASWQDGPESAKSVAVKLFKGAVTSDGLPRSEKTACIAAGAHPNLIAVKGRVSGHPAGTAGLVLSLLDKRFGNLAEPPSLDTCTRDIYPDDRVFPLKTVLSLARGIAAAAAHLHERGIMHGDLYAHNMLWNGQGDCLLGDFGAASFIAQEEKAHSLQRIEVRAFGIWLAELLERSNAAPQSLEDLWTLQRRCEQADIEARPLFAEIGDTLAGL